MTENQKITEQIFASIDKVGAALESTIDLKDDVYPYMQSTLAKIKELALKETDFQTQYELMQIATNYLPKALESYCGLPIEYRNKKIIKNDKTARHLLVEDIKIFKKEVSELETKFFAQMTHQMQVNSRVISDKYSDKFQLAHEVDELPSDGFVDQFDYEQYVQEPNYKSIVFKKELPKEKSPNLVAKKSLGAAKIITNKAFGFVKGTCGFVFNLIVGFFDFIFGHLGAILFLGLIGGIVLSLTTLLVSETKKSNYYEAFEKEANSIYTFMGVTKIPDNQFNNFVKSRQESMVKDSSMAEKMVDFSQNLPAKKLTLKAPLIDAWQCKTWVDRKELSFDAAKMYINGILLPQDNLASNYAEVENDNHKLCHLKNNNEIVLEFDNQEIFNFVKNEKINRLEKIAAYQREIDRVDQVFEKMSSKQSGYNATSTSLKLMKEKLKKLAS